MSKATKRKQKTKAKKKRSGDRSNKQKKNLGILAQLHDRNNDGAEQLLALLEELPPHHRPLMLRGVKVFQQLGRERNPFKLHGLVEELGEVLKAVRRIRRTDRKIIHPLTRTAGIAGYK